SQPLPQIPSPPLPLLSPPPTDPTYEEAPLGYRAARLRWRTEREEISEVDLPLRKRLFTAHTGTYELGESSAAAAARLREPVRDDLYRFVDTIKQREGYTPIAMEVGYGITDTWDDLSMDASDAAHSRVIALRTQVLAQWIEITDLRATDRRFQTTVGTQQEEIKDLRAAHRKLQAQFIRALTALKTSRVPETWLSSSFVFLSTSRAANALATPFSISAFSWVSVTEVVVVVVVVEGLALVVLFGVIFL
nr:hypothetical protein [Tanacetum cinerariifolium]